MSNVFTIIILLERIKMWKLFKEHEAEAKNWIFKGDCNMVEHMSNFEIKGHYVMKRCEVIAWHPFTLRIGLQDVWT
jgi:hypothetical protein